MGYIHRARCHLSRNVFMMPYDQVIPFLDSAGADAKVVSAFKAAFRAFQQTGRWPAGYQVFLAGEPAVDGVMLLEGTDPYRVHLTATTERSLRRLLLAFPRQWTGLFPVGDPWILERTRDLLAGEIVETAEGSFYRCSPREAEHRTISKRKDSVVSDLRKLATLKGKLEQSRFTIEGHLIVERAVADRLPVESVVYTADSVATAAGEALLRRAASARASLYQVNDGVMGSLTTTRPVPSILGAVRLSYPDIFSASGALNLRFSPKCVFLIAEGIDNPDNLGMTLRTADAAGVSGVILSGSGASPFHKNCIRASRGAVGRLPLFQATDIRRALVALRAAGWSIFGGTAGAETDIYATTFRFPVGIVVGNEHAGLSAEARACVTELVRIPMASGQSSLNVGVAAGVFLYEFVRRRGI